MLLRWDKARGWVHSERSPVRPPRPFVARKATAWVVELKREAPPGVCLLCQTEPLPKGKRVLCNRPQCARDYHAEYKRESRAKGRSR